MEKSYSVAEIDAMRYAIKNMGFPCGVSFYEKNRVIETEERLRTYMLAGISPQELYTQLQAQAKQSGFR